MADKTIDSSIPTAITEEYDIGETLGTGHFSKVKLGVHKVTKEKVAIKVRRFSFLMPVPATCPDDPHPQRSTNLLIPHLLGSVSVCRPFLWMISHTRSSRNRLAVRLPC